MSEADWARLEILFHQAMELAPGARQGWLEQHCHDPLLREELLALVRAAEDEAEPVDRLIAAAAGDLSQSATPRPRRLGAYRVLRRLGQGGMGTVYLAERDDAQYQQQVAIKFIRGFPGDLALERFRRERQILAKLQHPNIARLLDGGATEDGQPYLVMDYINGSPIRQWCRDQQLGVPQRVRLMMSVCDAIHHAHQHLIVHRDIKPGNILVTSEGRPIVMDFGIAKLLDDERGELTGALRFYTPGFASPEQLENGAVTTAADVFSLGRLLLHVLDDEHGDEREAHAGGWRKRVPRELVAIIEQATRAEPERRYPSVAAVRADLIRFLEGRSVSAVPDRVFYRLGKYARRHRPVLAAAALVLLVAASLSWRWSAEAERARFAEARMLTEARHAGQVLDFMLEAISLAEPGRSAGQEVTLREIIDNGYRQLIAGGETDPLLRARLLLALGEVYLRLELREEANELLEQASLTPEPATAVRALSLLGFSHTLDRQLEPARLALDAAFALRDRSAGLPTGIERELHNHHALCLLAEGDADAAEGIFAELVELQLADENLEEASRLLHNLGLARRARGLTAEARADFSRSLELKEATVGRLHPSYANTLQTLARSHAGAGDYRRAGELLEQSLALRAQLFGEGHAGLHNDHNELGNMHHDLGDFDRAIAHYRTALELLQQSSESPGAAAIYHNNLASALEDRGDWRGAEPHYRHSLGLRLEAYGDSHPAVALARHNLARLLIRLGRLDEARAELDLALAFRRAHFGEAHHITAYSESLEGMLAWRQGDMATAEDLLQAALTQLVDALPERNWWVLVTRAQLGRVLIELDRLDEAERMMVDLVSDYNEAFGPEHPHAAVLSLDLARIHLLRAEPQPAQALLSASQAVLVERMDPDSTFLRQWQCLQSLRLEHECWL